MSHWLAQAAVYFTSPVTSSVANRWTILTHESPSMWWVKGHHKYHQSQRWSDYIAPWCNIIMSYCFLIRALKSSNTLARGLTGTHGRFQGVKKPHRTTLSGQIIFSGTEEGWSLLAWHAGQSAHRTTSVDIWFRRKVKHLQLISDIRIWYCEFCKRPLSPVCNFSTLVSSV